MDRSRKGRELKVKYEIWLGYYHLGQGYSPPAKPQKVDEIWARSFKCACIMYEHKSAYLSLAKQQDHLNFYEGDVHLGQWYYNPKTNSNSWSGQYYESEEDAWKSFPKQHRSSMVSP